MLDRSDPVHAEAEERLRTEIVAWLTTVSPEGQAQSSPVWFLWDGETFLVFSRPNQAKLVNIAANPRVSLHLRGTQTGDDIVIFEGRAEILGDEPRADGIPDYVAKYEGQIDEMGWTPSSFAADYSQAIRISPTRARVW